MTLVLQATPDLRAPRDRRARRATPGLTQPFLAPRDRQGHKVQKAHKGYPESPDLRESKDPRDQKAPRVLRDQPELTPLSPAQKVHRDLRVNQVPREIRVLKAPKVR